MSKVVNVKVQYIRPEYKNLKEWCQDPKNVYIGRAGIVFIDGERYPKKASPFANPFKVGKDGTIDEVLSKYRSYIMDKIKRGEVSLKDIERKTMGCWCKIKGDEPCHGDILLSLLSPMANKCNYTTLCGIQCVRKLESGERCYQHLLD